MLDDYTKRGMILRATMRLAEQRGWRDLSLAEIARGAGVTLADVHREFAGKSAILGGFVLEVDRTVLRRAAPTAADSPRDRLFDVLMTRFEAMAPYKSALRRIVGDLRRRPGLGGATLACAAMRSHYWMLTAAGIGAGSASGALRVPALAAIYARVFDVWLDDDDPGLARTMATLDRQLMRGEQAAGWADAACATAGRLFGFVRSGGRRWRRRSDGQSPAAEQPHAG